MSIFRAPGSYTWGFVMFLYIASPLLLAAMLAQSLAPRNYDVPPEATLQHAEGKLEPYKHSVKSPYTLKEDNGDELKFGCWPSATYADCLDQGASNLSGIAQHRVRIGYFRRYNWSNSGLSNVLVELSADGQPAMTYAERKESIGQWAIKNRRALRAPSTLMVAAIFPLLSFAFAIWLTIEKKKLQQR